MILLIPITLSLAPAEGETFTRPLALSLVKGKPVIAWILESLAELTAGSTVLFVALTEHEDRFDLTGQIQPLLKRKPDVIVLDRSPGGELATVLRVRNAYEGPQELVLARGDRVVRSRLHEQIPRYSSIGPSAIVSVIGQPDEPGPVVRLGERNQVREVTRGDADTPVIPTGLCYFRRADQFVEAAEALLKEQETVEKRAEFLGIAEPVLCFNEYVRRGWTVHASYAKEVHYLGNREWSAMSCQGSGGVGVMNKDEG